MALVLNEAVEVAKALLAKAGGTVAAKDEMEEKEDAAEKTAMENRGAARWKIVDTRHSGWGSQESWTHTKSKKGKC